MRFIKFAFFSIDILWYHNSKFLKSNENIVINVDVEQMKASCIILNVTSEHVGSYQCKAVNDVSETFTKAKLELASAGVGTNITKNSKTTEKLSANTTTTIDKTSKEKSEKTEKTEKKIKTQKRASQKTKISREETSDGHITRELVEVNKPAQLEVVKESKTVNQHASKGQAVQVVTRQQHFEDENVEIIEETEEVHVKIYKELYSAEEVESFKVADEVNSILETIQAQQFGSGERPLRELATIGHLLKKGVEKTEIIHLYNADFFPALKLPESQSALVQLVERLGYENLIAEVVNIETADDENLLASTVGFRAFMRMVEVTNSFIEDIITNFKFEDFVSQEWKHKEIRENEYVEISESRVSSIRAETTLKTGNDFD